MHIILFDTDERRCFLPFTHTRPVADIRCGIMTMRERWELLLKEATSTLTDVYLQDVYPSHTGNDNLYINGGVFATKELTKEILSLHKNEKIIAGKTLVAFRTDRSDISYNHIQEATEVYQDRGYDEEIVALQHVWDIFSLNDAAIREDFKLLTKKRKSQRIPHGIVVTGDDIFIEEGAKIYPGTIINAETGPVYIAQDAQLLEGVLIRGPFAAGNGSVIKMGAKIYGATTIGAGCKVGGEVNNAVFFANSNKSHDGYLGNAVIGEWCNLGADTNCSNLKNNYEQVKIWDEGKSALINTGLTFCGLIMGDHSKCGINSMFNTGTVVGVSCNIYGAEFPDKFIPSFTWGGKNDMTTYRFDRAMDTANNMMGRRDRHLSGQEVDMYRHIFEHTAPQRISSVQK